MATVSVSRVCARPTARRSALDDITVDIADGEFFVILGPSGAGKTTTLKSIAGLVDIDAGSVDIGGTDVTLVEPYHRNVAMAFESYALYPQKTVSENLASPLKSGRTGKYTDAAAAPSASTRSPRRSESTTCSSAFRASCPTGSGSGWRSAGCWCDPPTSTCSTSR